MYEDCKGKYIMDGLVVLISFNRQIDFVAGLKALTEKNFKFRIWGYQI